MERETLSNNTEYQERLREGKIKGLLGDRGSGKTLKETLMLLYQESRQLQLQVSVVRSNIVNCAVSELFPSLATGE